MTKPDRFEEMVEQARKRPFTNEANMLWLLRRHHRAMGQMIRQAQRYGFDELISPRELLAALARYQKGTR